MESFSDIQRENISQLSDQMPLCGGTLRGCLFKKTKTALFKQTKLQTETAQSKPTKPKS